MKKRADIVDECSTRVLLQVAIKDPKFELAKVVCSHGFFMMAPNRWDPATASLSRPLRLASSSSSLPVRVSQPSPPPEPLLVSVYGTTCLSTHDQDIILAQVRRMLRISDDHDRIVSEFHEIHADAKERGFGRIFRSPTLFEDMVKTILLSNCTWYRALVMAKALCKLKRSMKSLNVSRRKPQSRKRKHHDTTTESAMNEAQLNETYDDFPSVQDLATISKDVLAEKCKIGYRAKSIHSLVQSIVRNKIQYSNLEKVCDGSTLYEYHKLNKELSKIQGFGLFTRANILMCIGFYHKIPHDTETKRHLEKYHATTCSEFCKKKGYDTHVDKILHAIYGKYAPFQYLAYWFELWTYYEETYGKTMEMSASDYMLVTSPKKPNNERKV